MRYTKLLVSIPVVILLISCAQKINPYGLASIQSVTPEEKTYTLLPITPTGTLTPKETTTHKTTSTITPTQSTTPQVSQELLDFMSTLRMVLVYEDDSIQFWDGEQIRKLITIKNTFTNAFDLYLTRDASKIIYNLYDDITGGIEVWTINSDGTGNKLLLSQQQLQSLFNYMSEDFGYLGDNGDHIFLAIGYGDDYEVDLDNGEIRTIHHYPIPCHRIMSPDSTKLAIACGNSIAIYGLIENNPIGIKYFYQTSFSEGPQIVDYTWTEDSKWIYFDLPPTALDTNGSLDALDPTTIWRMSAKDGRVEKMTHIHTNTDGPIIFSDDGEWMEYIIVNKDETISLYLAKTDGTYEELILIGNADFYWFDSSQTFIIYETDENTGIPVAYWRGIIIENSIQITRIGVNEPAISWIDNNHYKLYEVDSFSICNIQGECIYPIVGKRQSVNHTYTIKISK